MYDCYSVEFEVIVHHKEIGEFEADVVISVDSDAPLGFHYFVDEFESGDNVTYPEHSDNAFDFFTDIIDEFPEFFEVTWIDSDEVDTDKVGTVKVEDLKYVRRIG